MLSAQIFYKQVMLTPTLARTILHTVNLQINSNMVCISDTPPIWNVGARFWNYRQKYKNLRELHKSYPAQKLSSQTNLLSSIAHLYTKLRTAVNEKDEPMMHRYLTNELYQDWKDKGKQAFMLYPQVFDIRILQAQLCSNEYGRWIQCLIRMKHSGTCKQHIIQRKLGQMPDSVRTWYFVKFQN